MSALVKQLFARFERLPVRTADGFTLIELMIVCAIIGILAAIALPNYQGLQDKAKITEALLLAGDARKDIMDFRSHTGRFPSDNAEAGLPPADALKGRYVESIAVADGALHIRFNAGAGAGLARQVLSLRPAVPSEGPGATVIWLQGNEEAPSGMVPVGENRTTLSSGYEGQAPGDTTETQ